MKHKEGMQHYLFYMLKDRFFKDNLVGNGAIFASISKNELLAQVFTVPSANLVKQFNGISATFDDKITALDEEMTYLQESRDRLLPKLMSGEMGV